MSCTYKRHKLTHVYECVCVCVRACVRVFMCVCVCVYVCMLKNNGQLRNTASGWKLVNVCDTVDSN